MVRPNFRDFREAWYNQTVETSERLGTVNRRDFREAWYDQTEETSERLGTTRLEETSGLVRPDCRDFRGLVRPNCRDFREAWYDQTRGDFRAGTTKL